MQNKGRKEITKSAADLKDPGKEGGRGTEETEQSQFFISSGNLAEAERTARSCPFSFLPSITLSLSITTFLLVIEGESVIELFALGLHFHFPCGQ